ncbi:MAG TPA: patatin-like phospholipase family protein [Ktedonobacterales bacterium]|nr:patatin-like phospholipase family protein [Ktedonobacterales bacterium]
MSQQVRNLDGVFEGGGVKGIGLIGAFTVIEQEGYEFVRVAGTSAGAIVASLLAAGYHADELKRIMMNLDFNQFEDQSLIGRIPFAGQIVDELFKKGLYEGNYFLHLMRGLLSAKGIHTFRDLTLDANATEDRNRYKLQVVASDISGGRMLVLPRDAALIGIAPDDLDVALAVRMSMSIPFFFMPVQISQNYIVDGGLLSNFPVEIFDSDGPPRWPTFGFKLVCADDAQPALQVRHPVNGPISELAAMFFTAMEAHDAYYLSADKFVRTIAIDTIGVASTDFTIDQNQKDALYQSGIDAATSFLSHWDFDQYKAIYRSGSPIPTRREHLLPAAS